MNAFRFRYLAFVLMTFILATALDGTAWFPLFSLFIGSALLGTLLMRRKELHKYFPIVIAGWSLLLFTNALSLFSLQLSISLHSIIWLACLIGFLLIILVFKRNDEEAIFSLLNTMFVMFGIYAVLQFIPNGEAVLHDHSIFYAQYDHAHIDVLVLGFFPLAVAYYRKLHEAAQKKWRFVFVLLILFVAAIGVHAGSQLTWALLGGEGLLLYFLAKDQKKIVAKILYISAISMSLLTFLLWESARICSKALQFCETFSLIDRGEYWRQAKIIIGQFPWTGVGLGNFTIPATRLAGQPYQSSLYAHNVVLQIGSEMGIIIGMISFLLFLGLLGFAVKQVLYPRTIWSQAAGVAICVLFTKLWFDFSFALLPNALLLGMLLVILFPPIRNQWQGVWIRWITRVTVGVVSLFLILYGVFWLQTERWLSGGNAGAAFSFLTLYPQHMPQYVDAWNVLNDTQKQQLDDMYWYSVPYMEEQLTSTRPEPEKTKYTRRLVELSPWERLNHFMIFIPSPVENVHQVVKELEMTAQIFRLAPHYGYPPSYEERVLLAQEMDRLADLYLRAGNVVQAAQWNVSAYEFDQGARTEETQFFDLPLDEASRFAYLNQIQTIPPDRLSNQSTDFAKAYLQWLRSDIQKKPTLEESQVLEQVEHILAFGEWMESETWVGVSESLHDRYVRAGSAQEAQHIGEIWSKVSKIIPDAEYGKEWYEILGVLEEGGFQNIE